MDWYYPLLASLSLILVSSLIAMAIGLPAGAAAWGIGQRVTPLTSTSRDRTSATAWIGPWIAGGFLMAMVVALALPPVLHAAAWEATAGRFGFVTLTQTGVRTSTYGPIGGLAAAGWIHGLIGAAMVALSTWVGLRVIDPDVVARARLDLPPLAALRRVLLPAALPWTTVGVVASATLAATEMTIADLFGFRTIADAFYLYYSLQPDLKTTGLTVTCPLAIPAMAVIAFSASRRWRIAPPILRREADPMSGCTGRSRWIAIGYLVVVAAGIVLVPLSGLIVKAGHVVNGVGDSVSINWSGSEAVRRILDAGGLFAGEFGYTAQIAVGAAILAVSIGWPVAAGARSNRRIRLLADGMSIGLLCVPGPVVGLAIVKLFQVDVPQIAELRSRTLLPTILAMQPRALPAAYWTLRAGYASLSDEVLDRARLDMGRWSRIWHLHGKMFGRVGALAGVAAAVIASGDLAATILVVPPGVSTVATRLFGLLHSGARYQEATLALWYVAGVVTLTGAAIAVAVLRLKRSPAAEQ